MQSGRFLVEEKKRRTGQIQGKTGVTRTVWIHGGGHSYTTRHYLEWKKTKACCMHVDLSKEWMLKCRMCLILRGFQKNCTTFWVNLIHSLSSTSDTTHHSNSICLWRFVFTSWCLSGRINLLVWRMMSITSWSHGAESQVGSILLSSLIRMDRNHEGPKMLPNPAVRFIIAVWFMITSVQFWFIASVKESLKSYMCLCVCQNLKVNHHITKRTIT